VVFFTEEFKPKFPLKNGHISTVWATLFRKHEILYSRERIPTTDQDFLDLDWIKNGNSKLLIIGHGLEGSSSSTYMIGLANYAQQHNYDIVAINWRGCSGEPNLLLSSYHTGKSEDLDTVVNHITSSYDYPEIYLSGFSMGGNICLKYAGEKGASIPHQVKGIVAISVPVDLESSSYQLAKPQNNLYMFRFLRTLKKKYLQKLESFPDSNLNTAEILKSKSFLDFDEHFTAPVNGFKNAVDYWTKASSKPHLSNIKIPTLLINALNDPFLAPDCFPYEESKHNDNFHLITPKYGGHVGFIENPIKLKTTWTEKKIIQFFSEI